MYLNILIKIFLLQHFTRMVIDINVSKSIGKRIIVTAKNERS